MTRPTTRPPATTPTTRPPATTPTTPATTPGHGMRVTIHGRVWVARAVPAPGGPRILVYPPPGLGLSTLELPR